MKTKALHVSRVHTKQLSHLVPRFRLQEFDSRDPCCLEKLFGKTGNQQIPFGGWNPNATDVQETRLCQAGSFSRRKK